MNHLLLRGDARRIPLADGSVHCICTSPPYFGLRDYGDRRQIGSEATPDEFVRAIGAVARELWRVLRVDGSWWLNLGDSFANDAKWGGSTGGKHADGLHGQSGIGRQRTRTGLKPKDLCLIPERVALALQEAGWYVRAKPPWVKPSPMCESTTDRPNVAHESVFLLAKGERYYFDMEAVRVPSAAATIARDAYSRVSAEGTKGFVADASGVSSRPALGLGGEHRGIEYAVRHDHETPSDPGGRHLRTNDFFLASLDAAIEHHEHCLAHLRSVRDKGGLLLSEDGDPLAFWLATQSFNGAHFATWPERLVRPMILASTSQAGCCDGCGAPWVRLVERVAVGRNGNVTRDDRDGGLTVEHGMERTGMPHFKYSEWLAGHPPKTTGWRPSCLCDAGPPVPCVVLDPFAGSGTTPLVALALGRRAIGIDLNDGYLGIAKRRLERPHARTPRGAAGPGDELPLFARRGAGADTEGSTP